MFSVRLKFSFFIVLINVFNLVCNQYTNPFQPENKEYFHTQIHQLGIFLSIEIILIYILINTSLALWLLSKNNGIKVFVEIYIFALTCMDLFYLITTGTNFGTYEAVSFVGNLTYAGAALKSFYIKFIFALLSTGAVFFVGFIVSRTIPKRSSKKTGLMTIPFVLSLVFLVNSTPKSLDWMPATVRIPLVFIHVLITQPKNEIKKKISVFPERKGVKHLFFIVDESINYAAVNETGKESYIKNDACTDQPNILNFGSACSFTNYSSGSHIAFISGAKMNDLPNTKKTLISRSSIFQYAKQAGYYTVLIDGQTIDKKKQNFIMQQDLLSIDTFIQPAALLKNAPFYLRDLVVANLLNKFSTHEQPVFAYVIKAGAHWPYQEAHPPEVKRKRKLFKSDAENEVYHYRLAVQWSVHHFINKLRTGMCGNKNSLILYTSDHGENYTGSGSELRHGSLFGAKGAQGTVPLLLIDFENKFPAIINTTSHYHHAQIFPTILYAMGYNRSFIKKCYGNTLFESTYQRPYFIVGDVFGRGRNAKVYLLKK